MCAEATVLAAGAAATALTGSISCVLETHRVVQQQHGEQEEE